MPGARPSLLTRIVVANAAVIVAAAALLAATPFGISYPAQGGELIVLAIAVATLVGLDALLVRRALVPVQRLRESMRRVDPLIPGERIDLGAMSGDVADLARSFNEMADRLEAERRDSARRALAGREEERRALARDLHDEVGQTLTALLAHLQRLANESPAALGEQLAESQEVARHGLVEVRRVVAALRPEMLEDLGLVSALRALSRRVASNTGIQIECIVDPALPALHGEAELAIYRVVQEALTNSVRHAAATRVDVALAPGAAGVHLSVRDDGRGLGVPGAASGGIRGMRERALLIGGTLAVREHASGGVEVSLEIPLAEVAS